VLPLQARYTNHGWLTPAAPDARRRCTEKTIFAVHNRMFPGVTGINPPWCSIRTLRRKNQRIASRRCDPWNKSGGRQPAVVFDTNAVPRESRTVGRPRDPWNKSGAPQPTVLCDTNAVPKNQRIASRRCDPRTRAAGVSPPCFGNRDCDGEGFLRMHYICTAHPAPAPRLAYASRS
jgi:hypothetical protein